MESPESLTKLLQQVRAGEHGKADEFARVVFAELRKLAASHLRREHSDTLQPTELVNECFLRLFQGAQPDWNGRAHFFGVAARSMRQIVVDRARRRGALKRPEGAVRLSLNDVLAHSDEESWQLLALDEALDRLERVDARMGRVVELRFFAGLSVEETAGVIGSSPATVRRDWSAARAWLAQGAELDGSGTATLAESALDF